MQSLIQDNQIQQQIMNQTYYGKRVPNTVLDSSTPKKDTLRRNQSYQNRMYNEDLIQLIAKIRALEDDLINQRFKNQSLQRKLIQAEKTIDELDYEITTMHYEIQKYRHEIRLSNQKNIQILKYEQNLHSIGEEITALNNVLVKKNQQYQQLIEYNKQLQHQVKKYDEQCSLLNINQELCKKELDEIILKFQLKQIKPHSVSFSNQVSNKFQLIKQFILAFQQEVNSKKQYIEKLKRDCSNSILFQKQNYIKLDYQHKLLKERKQDFDKKYDFMQLCYNQGKIEEVIQEMLKKEDQLVQKIGQLQTQNQQLRTQLDQKHQDELQFNSIVLKEKQSIIKSLQRQNKNLIVENNQCRDRFRGLQCHYQSLLQVSQRDTSRQLDQDLYSMKKLRKIQEENVAYKIKVEQLSSEISILSKELQILKGE